MSTDAGLAEIAGRFQPASGPGAGLDVELHAQVSGLLGEMRAERLRRSGFEQRMAQSIRYVPLLAIQQPAGTPATFASLDWVCKTGYVWAVQRVTAKGLGSTDTVWVYRTNGSGSAAALDSAAVNVLTSTAPAWTPGRTGMMLGQGDGIVVSGTTTASVSVSVDVIMMEAWIVPDFLL